MSTSFQIQSLLNYVYVTLKIICKKPPCNIEHWEVGCFPNDLEAFQKYILGKNNLKVQSGFLFGNSVLSGYKLSCTIIKKKLLSLISLIFLYQRTHQFYIKIVILVSVKA